MILPQTRYARSGNTNIAYQVFGTGDEYLIFIPGWVSNIEEAWNIPQLAAWMQYIAGFTRLVIFDKRGTGLSDRVNENELPGQDDRIKDLGAIYKALDIEKATLFGLSEGGPLALLFASRFPEMVAKIILFGSFVKWLKSDDHPYGLTRKEHDEMKDYVFNNWGQPVGLNLMAPSVKNDAEAQKQWATFLRRSASPGTAIALYEMNIQIDVRAVLKKIRCPVLILHRADDRLIESIHSKLMHKLLPNSELVITQGIDHLPWFGWSTEELFTILTFIRNEPILTKKPDFLSPEDIFILFEIRDYLQKNYTGDVSINFLCQKFGINEFKLKNGFKKLFNVAPISFVTKQRMMLAKQLLSSSGVSIAMVAEKCGYKHANNFSIAFKKEFGESPRVFLIKPR